MSPVRALLPRGLCRHIPLAEKRLSWLMDIVLGITLFSGLTPCFPLWRVSQVVVVPGTGLFYVDLACICLFWHPDPQGLCYPPMVWPSGLWQHLLGASSKCRISGSAPGRLSQKPHLTGSFALSHEKQCCGQAKYGITSPFLDPWEWGHLRGATLSALRLSVKRKAEI